MADLLRLLAMATAAYRAYAWLGASGLVVVLGVSWVRAALLMVAVVLGGCAVLPSHVERAATYALTDDADTTLAKTAAASTPQDRRDLSGFRLLPDGEEAIRTRLALIRAAEKSLDVQYYLIADDRTGTEFLGALREAAARGVRVRVLVDDLYANGEDALFAETGAVPNVEVRMFNPLPVRGGSFVTRVALSMHQFSRINHRMHNKLFIADGSLAVFGGRNIADEYFGRSEHANFIDADMLASGPVVAGLAAVFDSFWNSEHAYPIQTLVSQAAARGAGLAPDAGMANRPPAQEWIRSGSASLGAADEVAAGFIHLEFGSSEVIADAPSKVESDGKSEGAPALGTRELLERAESSAFVSSPYFIPGANDLAALARARRAGVDVQVLTNSMQSTDEPLVYIGFAKHAAALAAMGVDLREVSGQERASGDEQAPAIGRLGASMSRLHAKLAIVDRRWSSIGSFNMDKRSSLWNTEMVVHVDCVGLARELEAWVQANVPEHDSRNGAGGGSTPSASGEAHRQSVSAASSSRWWQRAAVAVVNEDFL